MKVLLVFLLWVLLFAIAWPLALLVLVLIPVIWLISIPFRLIWVVVEATLSFIRAILFLPARLLGARNKSL